MRIQQYSRTYCNLFDLLVVLERSSQPVNTERIAQELHTSERQVSRWIARLRRTGIRVNVVRLPHNIGYEAEPNALNKLDQYYEDRGTI